MNWPSPIIQELEQIKRSRDIFREVLKELLVTIDDLNKLGPEHPWSGGATLRLYEKVREAKAVLTAWDAGCE